MIPFFPPYSPMHYRHSFSKTSSSHNTNHFTNNSFSDIPSKNDSTVSQDYSSTTSHSQYFEIFGIRLYFDDILILCLLFFLYQEDVNDQLLFIALLLLLLS